MAFSDLFNLTTSVAPGDGNHASLHNGERAAINDIGARTRYGTGFPEGVVTAPVGTEYVDTAVTTGAVKWIKVTGAGNTGWKVAWGDTGRRLMHTATGAGDFTSGTLIVRRINSQVIYEIGSLVPKAGTGSCVIADLIPAGYIGNTISTAGLVGANGSPGFLGQFQAYFGGGTRLISYNGKAGNTSDSFVRDTAMVLRGELTWTTDNPWPATLPGTPA